PMLSKTNVKYIQSLHHKKLRQEEHCFIAEGPRIVQEFLSSGNFNCKMLCGMGEWMDVNKSVLTMVAAENIFVISEIDLGQISLLKTPNQVLAVFNDRDPYPIVPHRKLTLILDDIQDPGNMGTLIRIADWFAIENIVCSPDCVECYNPKVVQASMGSLGRVNIVYTDIGLFIADHKNIEIYAASLGGRELNTFQKIKEGMIIIGNESKGIREELISLASEIITIPRAGKADSLNAAVAAGIILSHLV
ncbi:MAG: RNA methyltransferase, partial [Ginsengibacter sp.]